MEMNMILMLMEMNGTFLVVEKVETILIKTTILKNGIMMMKGTIIGIHLMGINKRLESQMDIFIMPLQTTLKIGQLTQMELNTGMIVMAINGFTGRIAPKKTNAMN